MGLNYEMRILAQNKINTIEFGGFEMNFFFHIKSSNSVNGRSFALYNELWKTLAADL